MASGNRKLHDLAAEHGVERRYRDIADRWITVDDGTLAAVLTAMGVSLPDQDTPPDPAPRRRRSRSVRAGKPPTREAICFIPDFLDAGRCWGVTCQLYGLRSARNAGIGDFEDLARLGEIAAGLGADFLGVSPLHALFTAAPERCSPFSPSNRLLLNPLLIAVDRIDGFQPGDLEAEALREARSTPEIDYRRVAALKLPALRRIFERVRPEPDSDLDTLRARHGRAAVDHALFEAVSAEMVRRGGGAGWHDWPEGWRAPGAEGVVAFARDRVREIAFHLWLQEISDRQLGDAADRLARAGMRVGLYLDLAVGVAPDGSATWSDPTLSVAGARIGAPPDMFNAAGQDWGLAPLSPSELVRRDMAPLRDLYDASLRHAGALRVDHAMSLQRLFWIPHGLPASAGTYVDYPMARMLAELSAASRRHSVIVIGEDLGVVPRGYREIAEACRIQGYRVLMFERDETGFRAPEDYPVDALACVATHDTATIAGWWRETDITARLTAGLYDAAAVDSARRERAAERRDLVDLLHRRGLADVRASAPFSVDLAVAIHRLGASAASRLFAVQLGDLLGEVDQVNLPGTVDEHPNWRRRMSVDVEAVAGDAGAAAIVAAIMAERPKR